MSLVPILRAMSSRQTSFNTVPPKLELSSGLLCCAQCGESDYLTAGQARPTYCSNCLSPDLTFLDDVVPNSLLNLQDEERMHSTVLLPERWRPGDIVSDVHGRRVGKIIDEFGNEMQGELWFDPLGMQVEDGVSSLPPLPGKPSPPRQPPHHYNMNHVLHDDVDAYMKQLDQVMSQSMTDQELRRAELEARRKAEEENRVLEEVLSMSLQDQQRQQMKRQQADLELKEAMELSRAIYESERSNRHALEQYYTDNNQARGHSVQGDDMAGNGWVSFGQGSSEAWEDDGYAQQSGRGMGGVRYSDEEARRAAQLEIMLREKDSLVEDLRNELMQMRAELQRVAGSKPREGAQQAQDLADVMTSMQKALEEAQRDKEKLRAEAEKARQLAQMERMKSERSMQFSNDDRASTMLPQQQQQGRAEVRAVTVQRLGEKLTSEQQDALAKPIFRRSEMTHKPAETRPFQPSGGGGAKNLLSWGADDRDRIAASLTNIEPVTQPQQPDPPPPPPANRPPGAPPPPPPPPPPGKAGGPPPPPPPPGKGPPPPPPPPGMGGRAGGAGDAPGGLEKNHDVIKAFQEFNRQASGVAVGKLQRGPSGRALGGGDAAGGMNKVKDEIENRSSHQKQVIADREQHKDMIDEMCKDIERFKPKDMQEAATFMEKVEEKLGVLSDERMVLKAFPAWPERKLELLRELAARLRDIKQMAASLDVGSPDWVPKNSMTEEARHVVDNLARVQSAIDFFGRTKDEDARKFKEAGLPWDMKPVTRIKLLGLKAAKYVMKIALSGYMRLQDVEADPEVPKKSVEHLRTQVGGLLETALRFSFRCHQFAGGFDKESSEMFDKVNFTLKSFMAQRNGVAPPAS